jgi:1-acyl-sn-glycerol-3-phosphate acyltransferase
VVRPWFEGWENVPAQGPLLFVGNHTLFGVIDVPFLAVELWKRRRIALRGLGDHRHFDVPGWRDLLARFGVVDGTRPNCAALFAAGESVLVYPGGAREVAKRKGEAYRLLWKKRVGFAKMALAHDVTIVPFAALGVEDAWDIVLDGDELLRTRPGQLWARLGLPTDFVPPVAVGLGPTPLPRPERLYFRFGAPIPPSTFAHLPEEEAAWELREATRAAIEAELATLTKVREADPQRSLAPRAARAVGDLAVEAVRRWRSGS